MKTHGQIGIKKILFEPVASYYSDALNTLTSLVQALVLAIYGYEWQQCFYPDKEREVPMHAWSFHTVEFLTAFLVICVLWQRYTSHNQLYAWVLGMWDTLIPIVFSFIEINLILVIKKDSLNCFTFWFAILASWGLVAYVNTHYKFKSPIARSTYDEHFKEYGAGFSKTLFKEVKRFEDRSLRELAIAAFATWMLNLAVYFKLFSEAVEEWMCFFIYGAILFHLFFDNVWKYLFKSNQLAQYPFWLHIQRQQMICKKNWGKRLACDFSKMIRSLQGSKKSP